MYWTIPLIVSLAMNIAKLVYPMILIIASHVIIKIKFLLMEPVVREIVKLVTNRIKHNV